nr:MAG TPA: hypothetical protein [Caudoviricetes sp.]
MLILNQPAPSTCSPARPPVSSPASSWGGAGRAPRRRSSRP